MADQAQTPLRLDHAVICLPDLEGAVAEFEADTGLESVPGGRHQGHGTANRIIPLNDAYLELVSVVDHDEAAASPFGNWVDQRRFRPAPKVDGICFATDDVAAIAERLDLETHHMSRITNDGRHLQWTIAGLGEALSEESLPFFIQWHVDPKDHPGRDDWAIPGVVLSSVTLSGSVERLHAWLGGDFPGVYLEEGAPGVKHVAIRTPAEGMLTLLGTVG